EGYIVRTRSDRYGLPEKMGLVSGTLQASSKGFAFVVPLEKEKEDIFINVLNLNGAMNGDRVIARLLPVTSGRRREGEIIRILKHANKRVVGTYYRSKKINFVVPDNVRLFHDILILDNETLGARDKDKVVVEITSWPEARRNPEGRVVQVLGQTGEPGVDILSIIKKYGLETEFPDEVLKEADKITKEYDPEELSKRRDLRNWTLVTIDGADARDLDDAVSIKVLPDGNYQLGVHIADVSYYVQEGSALDKEALKRGTSVYFVDRVIPMLPPRLSNDICSLNAGEDRFALTVLITFSDIGTIKDYEIFPSIIRVKERMTYDAVRRILEDEDPELIERYKDLVDDFRLMAKLAAILRKKRKIRGAIDFDFPEAKVKLDDNGLPIEIIPRQRSIAEGIIEDFMIAANEVVARHLYELNLPAIYRVHEEPDPEKLQDLNSFLTFFGFNIKPGRDGAVKPRSFQEILERVKNRPEERVISTVMLRSMMHARYSNQCIGHFGLASPYYCHFTSPIRRYPDLVVHRILRKTWSPEGIATIKLPELEAFVDMASVRSSEREKVAEEAERESLDMKMVQYMERHIGEKFKAIISSVVPYGFYVELDNTVEGLVHISTLADDYYSYQDNQLALIGEHTGKIYRIGQPVEVLLTKVNVDARQLDFELVDNNICYNKGSLPVKKVKKRRRRARLKALSKKDASKNKGFRRKARKKDRGKRNKAGQGRP
ncbi:MAG: ribonuclease, partial [Clostridia bacterium]|nr:ribonuclease [Clostridia bacterium]